MPAANQDRVFRITFAQCGLGTTDSQSTLPVAPADLAEISSSVRGKNHFNVTTPISQAQLEGVLAYLHHIRAETTTTSVESAVAALFP